MYHTDDNIAAIASAPGGSCRGIVRLAGPIALECLGRIFRPAGEEGQARWAALNPQSLPTAIEGTIELAPGVQLAVRAYLWPGTRSYTRSPLVELHTVGAPPLLEWIVERLGDAGARAALPGEFTLRAFLAGRLDLTQAEAVLGVIDATGSVALGAALNQLAGGLAVPLAALRDRLLDLLAHLEAGLDFVEEDIEFISTEELQQQLGEARRQVEAIAAQMQSRSESVALPRVVLTGLPNVGKSSLFNALLQVEASESPGGERHWDGPPPGNLKRIRTALVSDVAGTTRDFLVGETSMAGQRLLVVDTAGVEELRATTNPFRPDANPVSTQAAAEAAAQALGDAQREAAAVTLLCIDASRDLDPWEAQQLAAPGQTRLTVLTKADRLAPGAAPPVPGILTSSITGQGLTQLRQAIAEALAAETPGDGQLQTVATTAIRCRESLRQAAQSLEQATQLAALGEGEELIAAEIRLALDALGQVTGAVYTDDILDRIFSRFCIGK